jgi:hypothetical protein
MSPLKLGAWTFSFSQVMEQSPPFAGSRGEFARQAVDVLKKRMKWQLRAWRLAYLCEKLLSVGRHDWSADGVAFDDRRSSICLPGAVSMTGNARLKSIPKGMLPVYESIVGLTDDVCDRRLNSEYRDLARAMTGALCRKRPSPLSSGRPRTWAGGIVYVLGRINFLGDKSFPPYMATSDLCAAFEIGESTAHTKARAIEEALGIRPYDPEWTLPSLLEKNPLVWMAEVNGLLVDLRTMPREVQEAAFAKGMIPYIPADRPDRS